MRLVTGRRLAVCVSVGRSFDGACPTSSAGVNLCLRWTHVQCTCDREAPGRNGRGPPEEREMRVVSNKLNVVCWRFNHCLEVMSSFTSDETVESRHSSAVFAISVGKTKFPEVNLQGVGCSCSWLRIFLVQPVRSCM